MATESMEMREREVSLKDLFVEILLRWRMILLAMLLGGIALGGLGYGRSAEQARAAEARQKALEEQRGMSLEERMEQWEAEGERMRSQLNDTQLLRVQTAFALRQRHEERVEYQQNSLLMQLNPLKIQQANLTFVIRTEDPDSTYGVGNAYEQLLTSTVFFEYVEEQCGIKDSVNELIALNQPGLSTDQGADRNSVLALNVPQSDVFVLNVRIRHDDAGTCSAMADAAEEFVRQQQKELEKTVGGHEVTCVSRSQGEVTDRKLVDVQSSGTTTLYSLSNYYSVMTKDFTDAEKAYYNYLTAGSPADEEAAAAQEDEGGQASSAAVSPAVKARVSVKYIVLGAVLFAFICVFGIFIKYIMNNRLRSTDSLSELYGIPQLGTVPALSQKRFLDVVDRWILKMRYRAQRRFTPEESVGLAAVAVKMAAFKKGAGAVCLLGCELKGSTMEICGQIKGQLEAAGLKVSTLSNVLYDAEALEQLGSVGSVVLVETAGVTLYDEILRELELLQRQEITVLGGIVAE